MAFPASTESELDAALDAIARQQFDALLVVASPRAELNAMVAVLELVSRHMAERAAREQGLMEAIA